MVQQPHCGLCSIPHHHFKCQTWWIPRKLDVTIVSWDLPIWCWLCTKTTNRINRQCICFEGKWYTHSPQSLAEMPLTMRVVRALLGSTQQHIRVHQKVPILWYPHPKILLRLLSFCLKGRDTWKTSYYNWSPYLGPCCICPWVACSQSAGWTPPSSRPGAGFHSPPGAQYTYVCEVRVCGIHICMWG